MRAFIAGVAFTLIAEGALTVLLIAKNVKEDDE